MGGNSSVLARLDAEHRFPRETAIAQLDGDLREVTPTLLHKLWLHRAVGDERDQQCEVRREALLGFRGEIRKALDARVWMFCEIAKADLRPFARGIAEDDDRSLRLDAGNRRGQRRPARGFEDQRK